MKDIKVTVIIPIYNVEKYLRRCLDSVVKQTYSNIEVIIVDDGSTDNSAEIAQSYVEKYSYIKLIRQSNHGLGGARNTGIKYSTGEYITMPDSDDWLHEDYLSRMVNIALKYNADVVECNGIQVWDNGSTKQRRFHINGIKSISNDNKIDYLKSSSFVVWNKLFKRTLIGSDYPFHEHMTKQDYAWTPLIIDKAKLIVQIPDILYYYYWRADSATNKKRINYDLLKAQQILESNVIFRNKYANVLRFYFVRNIMGDFIWALSLNNKNNEISSLMNSARYTYSGLEDDLPVLGKIKSIWGKLILNNKYITAHYYAVMHHFLLSFGRMLLNFSRKF